MKKDRLASLPPRAPTGQEDNLDFWKATCEKMRVMLVSYKKRQEAVVMGLGKIQKRPDLADVIVQGILEQTLSVAKKRVKDREDALQVAVDSLTGKTNLGAGICRVKELAPDLFEDPETPEIPKEVE